MKGLVVVAGHGIVRVSEGRLQSGGVATMGHALRREAGGKRFERRADLEVVGDMLTR